MNRGLFGFTLIAAAAAMLSAFFIFSNRVAAQESGDTVAVSKTMTTQDGFIDESVDIPLAPSLVLSAGAGLVFDSPSGRIVEAFATGTGDRDQLIDFYAATLPALGWKQISPTLYGREDERLSLTFFGSDGALSVRFTLSPE